jgi:Neuraminidase (sialidase)
VALDGGDLFSLGTSLTDAGMPFPRRMVSRTLATDGKRFTVSEIEIFPRQGFNAASIMLRMSRDNGITWGAPKVRSFVAGQYAKRVIWRMLGQFRQATAEITISDAKSITMNAEGRAVVS